MEQLVQIGGHKRGLGATLRLDAWWVGPAVTVAVFSAFLIYSTWALLQGDHYFVGASEGFGGYLSPMFSPTIFTNPLADGAAPVHHAWFGTFPTWWPQLAIGGVVVFIPMSPAA